MATRHWYVTGTDRTRVNWGTAVAGGVATIRIFEIVDADGGADEQRLWAAAGAPVTPDKLARAQALESADAVPAHFFPRNSGPAGGAVVDATDAIAGQVPVWDATAGKFVPTDPPGFNTTAPQPSVSGLWRFDTALPEVKAPGTGNGAVDVLHATGDKSQWEVRLNSTGRIFHFTLGPSSTASSAAIGIGIDNRGSGILLANKLEGVGLYVHQQSTITSAAAFGVRGQQDSTVAPVVYLDAKVANSAPLLELWSSGHTPTAAEKLTYWRSTAFSGDGALGYVESLSGRFHWKREVLAKPTAAGVGGFLMEDHRSQPDMVRLRSVSATVPDVTGGTSAAEQGAVLQFHTRAGSSALYYPHEIRSSKKRQSLMFRGSGTLNSAPADGSETWATAFEIKNGDKLAFFGADPVARRAATADASDLATAITLVNALKADLVALGLKAAA